MSKEHKGYQSLNPKRGEGRFEERKQKIHHKTNTISAATALVPNTTDNHNNIGNEDLSPSPLSFVSNKNHHANGGETFLSFVSNKNHHTKGGETLFESLETERIGEMEDDDEDVPLSIDDAIEMLGMGPFQFRILVTAGLCLAADSMEILLLSFLAVVLQAQWKLTNEETASITSAVFLGSSLGTLVLGSGGDLIGRKPIFWLTTGLICLFGLATAFTNTLPALVVCRFMVGFGGGGFVVPFNTLAEFVPDAHRGSNLLLIEYFWSVGTLLVSFVARLTLGRSGGENEWRWFVGLCSLPCFISSVASIFYVPESPRWLLAQGKPREAMAILRRAARINGKDASELFPVGKVLVDKREINKKDHSPNVCDLFQPKWRQTTLLLWSVFAGHVILTYATIIAVTLIFVSNSEHEPGNSERGSSIYYEFDYSAILASASSELAGITLVIVTVDRVGRIPSQVVSLLSGGVAAFSLCALAGQNHNGPTHQVQPHRYLLIFFSFVARLSFMAASCVTWVSTAEILTTDVRSTGHAIANAIGRLGGALSPFLIGSGSSLTASGTILLAISVATALCAAHLPETLGQTMGVGPRSAPNVLSGRSEYTPV